MKLSRSLTSVSQTHRGRDVESPKPIQKQLILRRHFVLRSCHHKINLILNIVPFQLFCSLYLKT